MGLDAICLSAVLYELRRDLVGGRIEKIYQPGRYEVVLTFRTPVGHPRLLLSAASNHARAQLTNLTWENPAQPPMFCMLLRKHLNSGRLLEISQPPEERIAEFVFETTTELGDREQRTLVLECMGIRTNLILLDQERRIIDCLHRAEGDLMHGKRAVLPGLFYQLPEPHHGLSPLIRREQEARGEPDSWGEALWEQVSGGEFTPTLLLRQGKPADFSFLPITQYGPETTLQTYENFSILMDDFYAQRDHADRVKQRGQDLIKTVTNARDRTVRKLAKQRQDLEQTEGRDRLRELGDLLTSNLYSMQKGMSYVRVSDYYDPEGAEVEIPLDTRLTPQQNAAKYYKEYTKAKTANRMLTQLLQQGEEDLTYLEGVLESISKAEGEKDLQEIRQELQETGFARQTKQSKGREKPVSSKPMEFRSSAGMRISVGKNNSQNDRLTTRQAGKLDLWLHTQKIHGSHVIVWCDGAEVDEQTLTEAAKLAAWFSQGRDSGKVAVDYTPVKYVKKPSGAKPGMVVYTTYQTITVTPEEALVKRLRVKG